MTDRWSEVAAVPEGGVLLHIGPFKTGTTAIQASLASARPALARHDTTYPGPQGQHARAAMSALGRTFGWAGRGGQRAPKGDWHRLVREVRAASGRVVISSEYFCLARPRGIERVCQDLGLARVHVVITLRPLGLLLPSSWQQYVRSGRAFHYEDWLRAVLADPPDKSMTPSFWVRNDHADLARRWAAVVGPENVTVVVLDDADRAMLFEVFQRLLALPAGVLHQPAGQPGNRSLSAVESELLRAANEEIARQHVSWSAYQEVVRDGAVRRLVDVREPAPEEARITTPGWALDRAAELGAGAAADLRASGVQVVGDLDLLGRRLPDGNALRAEEVLPLRVGVEVLLGAFSGSLGRGPSFGEKRVSWPRAEPPADDLDQVPARRLVQVAAGRVRRRARARLGSAYRRLQRGRRARG